MVPWGDMINTSFECNVDLMYNQKEKAFIFKANRNIEIGEELTVNYGYFDMIHYFIEYGFIYPDAKFSIQYTLELEAKHPYYELKSGLMKVQNAQTFEIGRSMETNQLREMVAYQRFLMFDGD
jgi:hypothetical protein